MFAPTLNHAAEHAAHHSEIKSNIYKQLGLSEFRIRLLEERDSKNLERLLDMARSQVEWGAEFKQITGKEKDTSEAARIVGLVNGEITRRAKLVAGAPTFKPGDTVRICRELSDWNRATSAQPTVGMTGVVVTLDSQDARFLPEGDVAVQLSMAELGYEVDDEDSTTHVFFIHAWALEAAEPSDVPSRGI